MKTQTSQKKMNSMERYRHKAYQTLAGFQLLEETIKDFIGNYHSIVSRLLPSDIVYEFTRDSVKNKTLKKLCDEYLIYIFSDKSIVKRISPLIRKRDLLAHKALLDIYTPSISDAKFEQAIKEYTTVTEKLTEIINLIIDEQSKLENSLERAIERKEKLIKALELKQI